MIASSLHLGVCVALPWQQEEGQIVCDDPALTRFVECSWFCRVLEARNGTPFRRAETLAREARISQQVLRHPALFVGATGQGKSRAIEHTLREQMRSGQSILVLDPKGETIADLLALAKEMNFPPERITLISARQTQVPGWNPLGSDLPIVEAVGDIVSVLEKDSRDSWGRRLSNLLNCALLILAAHQLSLYELPRFFSRDAYRSSLIRKPPPIAAGRAYVEARQFFTEEYDQWTRSARNEATAPVLNKIRGILRHEYLAPLLCARENTFDLSQLWREQRLVLVHLDETALGDEGARLLAGMLANLLFRAAQRMAETPHLRKNAVVFALDELASVENLVGEGIAEICTKARSMELRLVVACQHLSQLSEKLRTTLLSNTDARLMFRLGSHADAKAVAAQITEGEPVTIARCQVSRESGSGVRLSFWKQAIYDEHGRRLRLRGSAASSLAWGGLLGERAVDRLYAAAGEGNVQRLYVTDPESEAKIELRKYLRALRAEDYWTEQQEDGLILVIGYPRPKVTGIERWTPGEAAALWAKTLMNLPIQHCVFKAAGEPPVVVRIADIAPPRRLSSGDPFLKAALGGGQSEREIAGLFAWRDEQVNKMEWGETPVRPSQADGTVERGAKKEARREQAAPPQMTPAAAVKPRAPEATGRTGAGAARSNKSQEETSDDGSIF